MDSKGFKFRMLNGSIARRVFFRTLFLAAAISIVSVLRFIPNLDLKSLTPKTYVDCVAGSHSKNATLTPGSYLFQSRIYNTFWASFDSITCHRHLNLTLNVVKELMGKRFLNCEAKSLCLGDGSSIAVSAMQRLGFSNVNGVQKQSFSQKKIVYELEYRDCSFDFVFSKDVDKVSDSVPALLVLEVERILKPGGIGALLVASSSSSNPNDLIRSITPVSSLLRSSSVVHVGYVNELNLVVFKKRSENTSSFFYQHHLPQECASVTIAKPLIELMEPLVEETQLQAPPLEYEKRVSYLPKFVDVSNKKRLVYLEIGVREKLNENNVTDRFLPSYYPIHQKAFSVYFVHYNTSTMPSHVKGGSMVDPFVGEKEGFDFLKWFKETVRDGDFVVLKMNAGKVEMKLLVDLFESGDICFVDEMFLSCSESGDGESNTVSSKGSSSCMDIYRGLRNNGVYVHQWWEGETKLHQGPQGVNVH